MVIEDKYVNLLGYDKQTKMNGILSELRITNYITGPTIAYSVFMNQDIWQ